jgi:hypothetical protein
MELTKNHQKTPIQKLIDYIDFNRTGEDGEKFHGKIMAKAIELLKEEKELLKSFYLEGDSNGCGCYDYSNDKDAEDYFTKIFPRLQNADLKQVKNLPSNTVLSVVLSNDEKEFIYQKERKKYEGSSWEVELDYNKETFMSGIDALIEHLNERRWEMR